MTTEKKWTPGPWQIVWYDAGDKDEWAIATPLISGSEEADRAVVHWAGFKQKFWQSADGKQSEIEANAHLIAAAPEMYDVLESLEYWFDIDEDVLNRMSHEDMVFFNKKKLERIRSVMAEARGDK